MDTNLVPTKTSLWCVQSFGSSSVLPRTASQVVLAFLVWALSHFTVVAAIVLFTCLLLCLLSSCVTCSCWELGVGHSLLYICCEVLCIIYYKTPLLLETPRPFWAWCRARLATRLTEHQELPSWWDQAPEQRSGSVGKCNM